MYHYTYISSDNKRFYIGVRSSKEEPLKDNYFGSFYDKSFKPFKKKILSNHYTREDAILAEIYWHDLFQVHTNKLFANKAKQTSSKFCAFNKNRKHTKETKEKLSKLAKERFENSPHPWQGRKHTKESRLKMSESLSGKNSPWYGKKHKESTKEKQRIARGHDCRGSKNLDVYTFFCCATSETYIGNPTEFSKAYNLNIKAVGNLVRLKSKSSNDWILL